MKKYFFQSILTLLLFNLNCKNIESKQTAFLNHFGSNESILEILKKITQRNAKNIQEYKDAIISTIVNKSNSTKEERNFLSIIEGLENKNRQLQVAVMGLRNHLRSNTDKQCYDDLEEDLPDQDELKIIPALELFYQRNDSKDIPYVDIVNCIVEEEQKLKEITSQLEKTTQVLEEKLQELENELKGIPTKKQLKKTIQEIEERINKLRKEQRQEKEERKIQERQRVAEKERRTQEKQRLAEERKKQEERKLAEERITKEIEIEKQKLLEAQRQEDAAEKIQEIEKRINELLKKQKLAEAQIRIEIDELRKEQKLTEEQRRIEIDELRKAQSQTEAQIRIEIDKLREEQKLTEEEIKKQERQRQAEEQRIQNEKNHNILLLSYKEKVKWLNELSKASYQNRTAYMGYSSSSDKRQYYFKILLFRNQYIEERADFIIAILKDYSFPIEDKIVLLDKIEVLGYNWGRFKFDSVQYNDITFPWNRNDALHNLSQVTQKFYESISKLFDPSYFYNSSFEKYKNQKSFQFSYQQIRAVY